VCAENSNGFSRLNEKGFVVFQGFEAFDDRMETVPIAGGLPGSPIDDQVLGIFRHLGVQVVHQHPERAFLAPAMGMQSGPARRPDGMVFRIHCHHDILHEKDKYIISCREFSNVPRLAYHASTNLIFREYFLTRIWLSTSKPTRFQSSRLGPETIPRTRLSIRLFINRRFSTFKIYLNNKDVQNLTSQSKNTLTEPNERIINNLEAAEV
jgi:hypothetical protein